MVYKNSYVRKWHLLRVYNFYRLSIIILFFCIYWYELDDFNASLFPFNALLTAYALLALIYFILFYSGKPKFEKQVISAGVLDLFVLTLMITALAKMKIGLILLLNVNVAILSILMPGRMAIFFAAIASFMLLSVNSLMYFKSASPDHDVLFYTGMHGLSFFVTAMVAWYLANLVKTSEELAARRMIELREIEKINEYIVARLHAGIIYTDQNQNIKIINGAAKRFFKIRESKTPAVLKDVSLLLAKKFEAFCERSQEDTPAGQTSLPELQLKAHFYFASPKRGGGVFIFIDDLSAVHQTAQQLKLAALGRFTASIAHELHNPLGAIAHAVQLLGEKEELEPDDQRLKEMIASNCNRMNSIIKNILQLSRREQSAPRQININLFLHEFIKHFKEQNQCEMILKIDREHPPVLSFDPSQLEQILINICENALIHGKDGNGKVKIILSLEFIAGTWQLHIQDNGKGINIDNKEEIFEPFFSTSHQGTGMGLFIAKDLCEINQAQLYVLPSKSGACFVINFSHSNEIII